MTANQEKKDFMFRWYDEVWNKGNGTTIDEMLHPECKAYGLGNDPVIGPEGFKLFHKAFNDVMTDFDVKIDKILVDGNFVSAMCSVKAKHKATGQSIQFSGVSIAEIVDNRLINGWNYFDFLGLNIQLGNVNPERLLK